MNGLPLAAAGQAGPPDDQSTGIADLLRDGQLDREAIAAAVGVSPGAVSAVESHKAIGTYSGLDPQADELTETSEVTFGLERDLQSALRSDIEQLEPGLTIADGGSERLPMRGVSTSPPWTGKGPRSSSSSRPEWRRRRL